MFKSLNMVRARSFLLLCWAIAERELCVRLQPQWATCQVQRPAGECLLNVTNPEWSPAYENVDCEIGDIAPYYVRVPYTLATLSVTRGIRVDRRAVPDGRASRDRVLDADWCASLRQEQGPRLQG